MPRAVSLKGRNFIKGHEGVVLKAYRDPVGVLTIGSGLTNASGVVTVKPGMVITPTENDRLLDLAMTRNYVPRVLAAMGAEIEQNDLDGAASFDFNTGGIHKASWVKAFLKGDFKGVRSGLSLWCKAGGKTLSGLVRRRAEEADIIVLGRFPAWVKSDIRDNPASGEMTQDQRFAIFVVSVTPDEITVIRDQFKSLGLDVGSASGKILRSTIEGFQKSHDLTVDGKIGRATLSTLQRDIDVRAKTKVASTAFVTTGATAGAAQIAAPTPDAAQIDGSSLTTDVIVWIGFAALVAAVVYGVWLAWSYRDMIATRIAAKAPRLAAWLRSV